MRRLLSRLFALAGVLVASVLVAQPAFAWNPLTKRKPVAWPEGARMAWCVYLYLE